MRVFISHKNEDARRAADLAAILRAARVDCYLDTLDTSVRRGPELADYLRKRIATCSHLLVVVSTATAKSWWVPWEIGVASERLMPLASFSSPDASLPEYLRAWPYLRTPSDVRKYIAEIKRTSLESRLAAGGSTGRAAWTQFHHDLKLRLGQS